MSVPTRPGRRPVREAGGARRADAAAAEDDLAERRRRARRGGEPARRQREAERRGHGRAAYTSLVLRSLKPASYSGPQPRPRRARQPRVLPLHLADPPLSGPGRPPCPALGARRRGGAPERGAVREAGRWCSEREREAMVIERDADRACAAFLLERELYESGPAATLRGRGLRRDRGRRLRPLRRRRSPTSTRASCRRGGWAASASSSTRPRPRSSARRSGRRVRLATR